MSVKHGAYEEPGDGKSDRTTNLYWMGEEVDLADFNERLLNQTKSVAKDIDMIQMGVDLKEAINEGQKADKELSRMDLLDQGILKLPLCQTCRALVILWGE